jgi:serine/threonine protein kinase
MDDTLFGGLGKQNHYILPILMALYFGEDNQPLQFPSDSHFANIESLPGYFGARELFRRLVSERNVNAFEERQLDRFFRDNVLQKARQELDPDFFDLLMSMLRLDPSKRIKASQAFKHRYFADLKSLADN